MVAISFSVFKDKILDGTKDQTIRPLLRIYEHEKYTTYTRKPRCKVGDTLQLYWKQRSKKVWEEISEDKYALWLSRAMNTSFPEHAMALLKSEQEYDVDPSGEPYPTASHYYKQTDGSQLLRTAKCTERFEIEMGKKHPSHGDMKYISNFDNIYGLGHIKVLTLAKLDGFSNGKEMFEWFETKYPIYEDIWTEKKQEYTKKLVGHGLDLSEPKRFEVVRWK